MPAAHMHPPDSIDDLIEAERLRGFIPGLAVAVVRGDEPVHLRGYGLANLEHQVPVTQHTVFEIGSITKPITATAVMLLVEQGAVALTDTLRAHLPWLPEGWSAVTLRHLLSHTSGIPDYMARVRDSRQVIESAEDVLALISSLPLEFVPGAAWAYSNTGYLLLGMLIAQVSGGSYSDFVEQRLFAPLDMTGTRCNDSTEVIAHRAQGYGYEVQQARGKETPWRNRWDRYALLREYACGDVLSTAADLATWDMALRTGKVLRPSVLEQMWSPAPLSGRSDGSSDRDSSSRQAPYGLGWFLREFQGHRYIGHEGARSGFSSALARFVDDEMTIIVLCNLRPTDPGRIVNRIANYYVPGSAPSVLDRSLL